MTEDQRAAIRELSDAVSAVNVALGSLARLGVPVRGRLDPAGLPGDPPSFLLIMEAADNDLGE